MFTAKVDFIQYSLQSPHSSPVSSCVLQGSVLGPLLLFTIFVNDIPSIVSSSVFMFADDTKMFRVIRNEEDYVTLQGSALQMVTTLAIEI